MSAIEVGNEWCNKDIYLNSYGAAAEIEGATGNKAIGAGISEASRVLAMRCDGIGCP